MNIINILERPTKVIVKYREDNRVKQEEIDFLNYFYIDTFNVNNVMDKLKNKEFRIEKFEQDKCKLHLYNNYDRKEIVAILRNYGIEVYEADLNAPRRYILDNDIKFETDELTWCFYDIETLDLGKLEKDINGRIIAQTPILSIAYVDYKGNKMYIKNENGMNPVEGEKELLRRHLQIIKDYDILSGWNSRGFDDTYCIQRANYHELDPSIYYEINKLDYMLVAEKLIYPKPASMKLDYVAQELLEIKKVEVQDTGRGGIFNLWKESFQEEELEIEEYIKKYNTDEEIKSLKSYNFKDVWLMYLMEQENDFIGQQKVQAELVGCKMEDTVNNSILWDYMCLSDAKKEGYISPTKYNRDYVKEVAGGFTFCFHNGIHYFVYVFDFGSFYPSMIVTCNICFTTIIDREYAEANGIPYCTVPADFHDADGKLYGEKYFRTDKIGILPKRMQKLLEMRNEIKYAKFQYKESDPAKYKKMKAQEQALKIIANSGYGYFAFKNSRYYNPYIANAITQGCRHVNKLCVEKANSLGYLVLQGDTDSIFAKNVNSKLSLEELELEFYKMFDEVAERYNWGVFDIEHKNPMTKEKEIKKHRIIFEHEKTFNKLVSIKKKNYATLVQEMDDNGKPVGKPTIDIKGLECIKKDTMPLGKELQRKLVVDCYLMDELTIEEFMKRLYEFKDKFKTGDVPVDLLIMQKGLGRPINTYGKPKTDADGNEIKKKDGTTSMSPVPAHVKLAKRMIDEGFDVNVGDMIPFIVKKDKPIDPIMPQEFIDDPKKVFAKDYYWERSTNPVLKVLFEIDCAMVYDNVSLWFVKNGKKDEQKLKTREKKFKKSDSEDDE